MSMLINSPNYVFTSDSKAYCDTYALNQTQFNSLVNFTMSTSFLSNVGLLFQSPGDYLNSLTIYPFNILTFFGFSTTTADIIVGNINSNIQGYIWVGGAGGVKLFAQYTFPEFTSYLDFEPYTTYEIFLPFIGFQRLDTSKISGKTIRIWYTINYQDGSCKVYIDDATAVFASFNGMMGVRIPIGSSNYAETIKGIAAKGVGLIGSAVMGFVGQSAAAAIAPTEPKMTTYRGKPSHAYQRRMANYEKQMETYNQENKNVVTSVANKALGEFSVPTLYGSVSGNPSGECEFFAPNQCYIIKSTTITPYSDSTYAAEYNHLYGRPSCKYGTLSQFSGYTEVAACHMDNIPATKAELDLIDNTIKSGIII